MKRQYATKLKLPDEPGIYIFRDYKNRPLYIGRATSLRSRVLSYFAVDIIETRGPRIVDMLTKAKTLTWTETDSVLEAVLLESASIKKYQPFYNVDEKDDKSAQYVIITDEDWPRVFLARVRDFDQANSSGRLQYSVRKCFGPFVETGLIKEALRILRRLFPFRDIKSNDPRHKRFYEALGRSPRGEDNSARKEYLKNIRYLTLFFEGQSSRVRRLIEIEMRRNARNMEFERAAENRKLIYALTHINDIALLKREQANSDTASHFRIEAFDIAHLAGQNVVGSMAVSIGGQAVTSEYRRFKLSEERNDDIAGLMEIVSRRLNHPEWEYPDIIVVDGDDRHIRAVQSILQARRVGIPVVAVTKNDKHKAARLTGSPELIKIYSNAIISTNAEAHRFAISYHRKLRRL